MDILTQIPIGTKLKVKVSDEIVILEKICFFPTRYKTTNESGTFNYYRTHEVEIVESEEKSD